MLGQCRRRRNSLSENVGGGGGGRFRLLSVEGATNTGDVIWHCPPIPPFTSKQNTLTATFQVCSYRILNLQSSIVDPSKH